MSIIDPRLLGKIDELRAVYTDPDSIRVLDGIEKRLQENLVDQGIPDIPAIREIVAAGQRQVEDVNFLLLNDEKMDMETRGRLIERRNVHEFYATRLSGKHTLARIESIERFLDARLKTVGDTNG